jgi:hypothetical protein
MIIIIVAIIIIIIIIGLITHLSIYLLGNLHLSLIVGWIRLSQGKFTLSLKVKGQVLGICILYDTFVIVFLFAPLLKCFWLNIYSLDSLESFGDPSFHRDY